MSSAAAAKVRRSKECKAATYANYNTQDRECFCQVGRGVRLQSLLVIPTAAAKLTRVNPYW